jgi:2-oxoglutarate ferredoxin oxidoreductase subunit gamma
LKSALIAGSGGQGILFLGKLLAHAAMLAGRNVTWFPSYGAEMRGGTANCTVIVSDDVIGSPSIKTPDILIVLNEASRARFEGRLKQGGLLITDSSLVSTPSSRKDVRTVEIPATEIASGLGNPKSANMVIIGALISVDDIIDRDTARAALVEMTPERRKSTLGLNREAIEKGRAYRGNH